jgi:hypothetical protein
MSSFTLFDSTALIWAVPLLLGVWVLYYYSTKTDIPKINGIPEIPGALPMYFVSSSELMKDMDI